MRSANKTLGLAALAVGGLLATTAFAQNYPNMRTMNDGGYVTEPGAPSGQSDQPGAFNNTSNSAAPNESGMASNCAARFHSFDPSTGTYLGFDGRRHSCP